MPAGLDVEYMIEKRIIVHCDEELLMVVREFGIVWRKVMWFEVEELAGKEGRDTRDYD